MEIHPQDHATYALFWAATFAFPLLASVAALAFRWRVKHNAKAGRTSDSEFGRAGG